MRKQVYVGCEECRVKNDSLFKGLPDEEIENINYHKSCAFYKKGQILFHEGTRPLGVYCVNQGKIKVYRTGDDGKDQIIKIATGGDLLGYKALVSDELYPVSGETLENTKVCFIPKSEFLGMLTRVPSFGQQLLQAACHELGAMTQNITSLAQKSVRERLAVTLLMLKDTYDVDPAAGDDTEVEINLTREDLANIVGTATETIIRLLHDFKDEKLIETKGRKIKVLEPEKLIRVGNI
ncbi:Crp/Fnr family transcriptional regulator [Salibacter halophilus]|uniref:Crp/Fnr family transcriptional regulator n=1 Tax=Salibacter halophilus TaxID=1803916 RepID=A0A6N6M6W6_9FLAO|nr:Crp/Fnr family transcriptional regulator [Salibacter halophilus]KAB1065654.1 Crp/Fnr family transcriptional regulator [Salibacter halophilus]